MSLKKYRARELLQKLFGEPNGRKYDKPKRQVIEVLGLFPPEERKILGMLLGVNKAGKAHAHGKVADKFNIDQGTVVTLEAKFFEHLRKRFSKVQ